MNPIPHMDAVTLATIAVTFNPDIDALAAQMGGLPQDCVKVVIDNASEAAVYERVQSLVARFQNVTLLHNEENIGLAAAINRGARVVSELDSVPRFVLLLDQDSEPQPGSIGALIAAFQKLEAEGNKVGCVGPSLRDPATGLMHGFHECTRLRWKRIYPPAGSVTPIACANLNGSGTLVPLALFLRLGGLDESFFIDHVDTEWAFRVLHSGYSLWGIPNAEFAHRMGQTSVRFWWCGWRVWPLRSPQRHFYLFRNAVLLMRRSYVPTVWKTWAVVKLILTVLTTTLTGLNRLEQLTHMIKGIKAGIQAPVNSGVTPWRAHRSESL